MIGKDQMFQPPPPTHGKTFLFVASLCWFTLALMPQYEKDLFTHNSGFSRFQSAQKNSLLGLLNT